ncbi:hypothetical protein [Actinomadura sp. NTSP31]|uniref:hypothetical protein n=1 Tax=Actinomadura sp. NTSP31 TaxID=1735447 RepID=UPI0035C256B3
MKAPRAVATPLPPAGRRTQTWFTYECPHCDGIHLGRTRDPDALLSARRGSCGRLVDVVISDAP